MFYFLLDCYELGLMAGMTERTSRTKRVMIKHTRSDRGRMCCKNGMDIEY